MIAVCPACRGTSFSPIHLLESFPIFQLVAPDATVQQDHFGRLEIVRCSDCKHMFNRGFNPDLFDRMYREFALTNVPVNAAIPRGLEELAAWISPAWYTGGHVVDIGGGSGHLARLLARKARSILVFEPSEALAEDAFPEPNITLIKAAFDPSLPAEPADLVVCKQVLEHMADPLSMLGQIRESLAPQGRLYLEVPRAESIEEKAALCDFHYAHVQYFHESNLLSLAAKAGLDLDRLWRPVNGHEIGLLLRLRDRNGAAEEWKIPDVSDDLPERLLGQHSDVRERMSRIPGRVSLFGASWHGVSFLTNYDTDREFSLAVDDNPSLTGGCLYSRNQTLKVAPATVEALAGTDGIMITAYLHQEPIRNRLRQLGYRGQVISVHPSPLDVSD